MTSDGFAVEAIVLIQLSNVAWLFLCGLRKSGSSLTVRIMTGVIGASKIFHIAT